MNKDLKDSEPLQKTADILHLDNWQPTEGDLEQREREQAARLADATAQYQEEVENMFGEEWDRQHKQYNLRQLRYMLKSSLQREQGAYIRQRAQDAEIKRLRAELAAYETKFAEPTDRAAQLARLISASGLL